ncbi:MAG: diguanylate cyclase [Alphaproteobacteria bacterium]|nr:diguanylate cyclase [Alphaproteobacteria bacterium]
MPSPVDPGLPVMGDVVDGVISVMMVESGLSACPTLLADMQDGPGHSHEPNLQPFSVPDLEAAAAQLRNRRVDVILLGRGEAAGIAELRASAAERPILLVTDDPGIDSARHMIGAGAEDVLLPADLKGKNLGRRIALAIARKAFERQLLCHAREDALTGLANGALLEERFIRALARADRHATLVGLVAIDLDGFDGLIAHHGQKVADGLLSSVGQRLLGETRQIDTLARTRDHGFTWLVEDLPAIDDISALVNRLPSQLARPFLLDGKEIRLTASAGVAICPFHGRDFQTVHGMAEAAMLDVSTISGDALLMPPLPQPMRSAALT